MSLAWMVNKGNYGLSRLFPTGDAKSTTQATVQFFKIFSFRSNGQFSLYQCFLADAVNKMTVLSLSC